MMIPKFLPCLNKLLPSPLIALIIGTAVYFLLMKAGNTHPIGNIPTGFPEITTIAFNSQTICIYALSLSKFSNLNIEDMVQSSKNTKVHDYNIQLSIKGISCKIIPICPNQDTL